MRRLNCAPMRTTSTLLLFAFATAGIGCGGASSYPEFPSTGSSYSASLSSLSSGEAEPSVPQRSGEKADLIVRPDKLELSFALHENDTDAQKALATVKARVGEIAARIGEATGGAAEVKMCGVAVQPASSGKKLESGESIHEYTVVVDGSITLGLAKEEDYWARSQRLAALSQATSELADKLRTSKDSRAVRFSAPLAGIKDPEAYREEIVAAWVKRARAFASAAESEATPLRIVDCAPPGSIQQTSISLEEVGLSLPVSCKIDTTRAAPKP